MEYYILGINIVAFIMYGLDKWFAKKGMWRIKESFLFSLALLGGGVGAIIGMLVFHHKTKKILFYIWNIIMILCWVGLIVWKW